MPTRALGDYRLKYKEFNTHEFTGSRGYRTEVRDYHGPYITHKPEIQVHQLTKSDKYLIMASDGLWDEMNVNEVASVFSANKNNQNNMSEKYFSLKK